MTSSKWQSETYKKSVKKETDSISASAAECKSVDLSGIIIGRPSAQLPELISADLQNGTVSDVDFSDLQLTGSMSNSTFERVKFLRADIQDAALSQSTLIDCDFSDSSMNVKFNGAKCNNTSFRGVKFKASGGLNFHGSASQFIDCDFSQAHFSLLEFNNAEFIRCNFTKAKFNKTPSKSSKFINCTFNDTSYAD